MALWVFQCRDKMVRPQEIIHPGVETPILVGDREVDLVRGVGQVLDQVLEMDLTVIILTTIARALFIQPSPRAHRHLPGDIILKTSTLLKMENFFGILTANQFLRGRRKAQPLKKELS
jgi:hypothetical protein